MGWQEAGFTCCTISPWAWDLLPKDGVSKGSEKLHPLIAVFQTVDSVSQAVFLRALVPLSKIDSDPMDPGVRDQLSLGNADVRGYVKGPEKPCSKGTSVLQTALMKEPLFWYYCVQPEGPWGFLEHSRGGQPGSDDPGWIFLSRTLGGMGLNFGDLEGTEEQRPSSCSIAVTLGERTRARLSQSRE